MTLREAAHTTGHCKEKAKPGGCQLHNLQCNYPACDRKEVQPEGEPGCRVCGSPIGSLHMAAGNLKCGWPARVQVSDCEPEDTQNVRTPAKLTVTLQDTECDRYKRMFESACVALGEIGDALGCDPNEGGSEAILDAIEELRAQQVAVPQETSHGIAHSLAGFRGGFHSQYGRNPTDQEIWNHAIRSWRDLNPTPQPAYVPLTDDLVLLVWRLAASLRRAKPGSEIAQQAIDFINRKGLTPSPLRQVGEQAVRGKT